MQKEKYQFSGDRDATALIRLLRQRLNGNGMEDDWGVDAGGGEVKASAVLFLLTFRANSLEGVPEPVLLLNKRSQQVLQPGDLCCPGGGIETKDHLYSLLLRSPFSPLRKWPAWKRWRRLSAKRARGLSVLMATALRECWEEMRLNPTHVDFLGPLPVQNLIMFKRRIFPLVGWVPQNQALVPNWEVERIVHLPLQRLLDTRYYARYRLSFDNGTGVSQRKEDFPCYIHHGKHGKEILWGATFRITMDFLKMVYGFKLPDLQGTPVIHRQLDETYLNGSQAHPPRLPLKEDREDF